MKKVVAIIMVGVVVLLWWGLGNAKENAAKRKALDDQRAAAVERRAAQKEPEAGSTTIEATIAEPTPTAPTPPIRRVEPPKPNEPQVDKSEAMQKQREELIQKLQQEGIFGEARTSNGVGKLTVQPAFYLLDFKEKQSFVSVVHAYFWDGKDEMYFTNLLDSKTNKKVGRYSILDGGLKLE